MEAWDGGAPRVVAESVEYNIRRVELVERDLDASHTRLYFL